MAKDMENHVTKCDRYLHFKQKPQRAEFNPTETTHPIELVHIDYLTTDSWKSNKDVNILVIMDHFTRYAQALITPSQTVKATVQAFWEKYIIGLLCNNDVVAYTTLLTA